MIRIGSGSDIRMNRNGSDWLRMNSYPILLPGLIILHFKYFWLIFILVENIISRTNIDSMVT